MPIADGGIAAVGINAPFEEAGGGDPDPGGPDEGAGADVFVLMPTPGFHPAKPPGISGISGGGP
jgi:hypothetical protein